MDLKLLDTQYDNALSKNFHFRLHPELLPFIGAQYCKSKLLLVGESHYVDCDEALLPEALFDHWYEDSTERIFSALPNAEKAKDYISWFDTRNVVSNFLLHYRSRAHTMFSNPAEVIRQFLDGKCPTDSAAFSCVAFFNYFQRPSLEKGATIAASETDCVQAQAIFQEVFAILKPECVIFLSRKASDCFAPLPLKPPFYSVDHPTSPWWHRRGKAAFTDILHQCPTLRSVEPMEDERIWLLKRIFSDFYNVLSQNKIGFQRYDEALLSCFYEQKNTVPHILLQSGAELKIDHRPYLELGDGKWQYLPHGGKSKSDVPNFRTNQFAYRRLYEASARNEFIQKSINLILKNS